MLKLNDLTTTHNAGAGTQNIDTDRMHPNDSSSIATSSFLKMEGCTSVTSGGHVTTVDTVEIDGCKWFESDTS